MTGKRLFSKSGLSLERLRAFVEIASAGGISNAVPGDPNRQSQFSRQLKDLEVFFGAELIARGHGRFELTAAGRELFGIVQSHFSAMEDLADRCADHEIELNIGAGESLLQWLVLPSLAEFRRLRPATTLVLHNLRTEEITSRLGDGRVDVGLLRQDSVRPPLASTRLGSIDYRLVIPGPDTLPMAGKKFWSGLATVPVALLAGSEAAAALEVEARKHGVRLKVCLRGSSYGQLADAVRQVPCAAVLPTFAADALKSTGVVVSLPVLKPFTRPMALAWNPRAVALRPTVAGVTEVLEGILRRRLGLS